MMLFATAVSAVLQDRVDAIIIVICFDVRAD
jgi:hypothetical protein